MIDHVMLQLQDAYRPPLLSMDTIRCSEVDTSISRHLKTKQTVTIHSSELKEIVEKYGRGTQIIDDFTDVEELPDYDKMKDPYKVSEYFGGAGMYIPEPNYVVYIKDLARDFLMNVYNGIKVNIPIPQVQNKIRKVSDKDLPNGFEFPEVESVNYTFFNGTKYQQNLRIGKYMYRFPVLSVNLPYEYYSVQDIPEHIYTIDFDRQEYTLAGKNQQEMVDLFNQICTNGIRKRLFMQIENGKIVSADDDAYAIMLIATYLKLPTIPVNLYMINNSDSGNLLISNRAVDIINKFHPNNRIPSPEEVQLINEICNPYFVFYHRDCNNDVIQKVMTSDYVANKEVTMDTIMDHGTVDFYLDELHQEPDIPQTKTITDAETQELHNQLQKEAEDAIKTDIDEYLKKINEDLENQ